jgi:hypothetical protein
MKVLIGVDPHKGSVAIAVVDEAMGELIERASFPQNSAGLKSLQRWAKRFGERRWAVENAGVTKRSRELRHCEVRAGVKVCTATPR